MEPGKAKDRGKKKEGAASPQFAYGIGLSDEEFQRAQALLGRGPTEAECHALFNLWSDDLLEEHALYEAGAELATTADATFIDISPQLSPLALTAGYANIAINRFPHFAPATLACELIEGLACAGALPRALSFFLRVGEGRAGQLHRGIQTVLERAGEFLNAVGVPAQGVSIAADQSLGEQAFFAAIGVGRAIESQRPPALVGSTVIFAGAAVRSLGEPDPLHRINSRRTAVQFPSPHTTRSVVDAMCALYRDGRVIDAARFGVNGAVGSIFSIAERRGVGLRIDLEKLGPERSLSVREILSIRSPHQLVVVCPKEVHRDVVESLMERGLHSVVAGEIIEEQQVQLSYNHQIVGALPSSARHGEVEVKKAPPAVTSLKANVVPPPAYLEDRWLDVLASANVASRSGALQVFDEQFGVVGLVERSGESALMQIDHGQVVALSCQSLAPQLALDAERGVTLSLAAGMREMAILGAQAVSFFPIVHVGDPQRESTLHSLQRALKGGKTGGETLLQLGVRGSFYNPTDPGAPNLAGAVWVFGAVAPGAKRVRWQRNMNGHHLFLVGAHSGELTAGEYLRCLLGGDGGVVPEVNLADERRVCRVVQGLISQGSVTGGVSVNVGGVGVALTRLALRSRQGVSLRMSVEGRGDALLFNELPGRFLLCCLPTERERIQERLLQAGVAIAGEGVLGGDRIVVDGGVKCELSVATARKIYQTSFAHILGKD